MIAAILALLAGCVPSLLVYFWLRNRLHRGDALYQKKCDRMLVSGFLTVLPVVLFSGVVSVLLHFTGVKSASPLLYAALYTFIVLALSEELSKFFMFRRKLGKIGGEHSSLELIIYSTIVGIGFGLLESIIYVVDSGPIVMLIRGITIPHGGYAAIVGYFYAKSVKEGKKGYAVLGVLIAFLIHGLYDFSLSEEIDAVTDLAGFIAIALAVLDLGIIIVLIVFLQKHREEI